MSSTGNSQLQADYEAKTRVSSDTGVDVIIPTTDSFTSKGSENSQSVHKPFSLPSKTVIAKPNKKEFVYVYQYKLLKEQYESVGKRLELDLESQNLTNLEATAKTRTKKVTTVVKQEGIDHLGVAGEKGKRAVFLIFYSQESGTDRKGLPALGSGAYWSNGTIDKQAVLQKRYDPETEDELEPELVHGSEYDVYTCSWSQTALDKCLENQSIEDIQFIVNGMNSKQSHGGYLYEEMSLSMNELLERGKLGRTGSPNDLLFSELSLRERLQLQRDTPK